MKKKLEKKTESRKNSWMGLNDYGVSENRRKLVGCVSGLNVSCVLNARQIPMGRCEGEKATLRLLDESRCKLAVGGGENVCQSSDSPCRKVLLKRD